MIAGARSYLYLAVQRARWRNRLPGLLTRADLMSFAQRRADALPTDFSHDGFFRRPAGTEYTGEIIGLTEFVAGYAAAAFVVDLWLGSPKHRAVLLGRWRSMGLGARTAGGTTFWVVETASPTRP